MSVFQFKQFAVKQSDAAMKVGTDSVLLGSLLFAEEPKRILDIGTGTGILALMMAQRFAGASIDAVEIDAAAAAEACYNGEQSIWNNRIQVWNKSFQLFATDALSYDLIVSNPPYYKATDNVTIQDEQRSRARHDSELLFDDLLAGSAALLSEHGSCWYILPQQEGEVLIKLALHYGLYLQHKISIRPKVSKQTNRLILGFAKKQDTFQEQMFTIYNEDQGYTDEYYQATKAFYLWKQYP